MTKELVREGKRVDYESGVNAEAVGVAPGGCFTEAPRRMSGGKEVTWDPEPRPTSREEMKRLLKPRVHTLNRVSDEHIKEALESAQSRAAPKAEI